MMNDSSIQVVTSSDLTKKTPNKPTDQQQPVPVVKKSPKDYIFGKLIGEGSFSTVYLAKDIHSGTEFAIKVCDKRHILREKKAEYVKREKEVLNILSLNHKTSVPFFVKLVCTFQDLDRLYFVLAYAKCGELLPHINKVGSFDVLCTKFYAAEILLALEHLHSLSIIHRDMKPENILLSEQMHILITDFGSAKILNEKAVTEKGQEDGRPRKNSFVGTAQYVSPELLTDKCASFASDLWAFGCIVYQMVSGLPPFRSRSEYLIFQKILKLEYEYPDGFDSTAKDLVRKLLVIEQNERLGAQDKGGYPSLRSHQLFKGVDFSTLYKQTPPPIYPYLPKTSEHDEMRSHYKVPDNLEPGLDDKQMTRLFGLDLQECFEESNGQITSPPAGEDSLSKGGSESKERLPRSEKRKTNIANISLGDLQLRIEAQKDVSKWHTLVQGNLILKQGLVDKRKGLFTRRRMLLLTLGPHLYYVDPATMILKGEIPWSKELRAEPKDFKNFFVHTPNRTYYLGDPEGYALEWCRVIEEVRRHTYGLDS